MKRTLVLIGILLSWVSTALSGDFSTYSDPRYGFTIDYPREWEVRTLTGQEAYTINFVRVDAAKKFQENYTVQVYELDEEVKPKTLLFTQIFLMQQQLGDQFKLEGEGDSTVAGLPAKYMVIGVKIDDMRLKGRTTVFSSGKLGLVIGGIASAQDWSEANVERAVSAMDASFRLSAAHEKSLRPISPTSGTPAER